jgi:hypothetical protein
VLFLYTPAAGGYIEALSEHRPIEADERDELLQRHPWEVFGPNSLEDRLPAAAPAPVL